MPGLNRQLKNFDIISPIEIQYPLELQNIDFLQAVAQASENKITMQVGYVSPLVMELANVFKDS